MKAVEQQRVTSQTLIPDGLLDKIKYDRRTKNYSTKVEDWLHGAGGMGLTSAERRVLQFLLGCTIRRGRLAEIVPKTCFMYGFIREDKIVVCPLQATERTIYRGINGLKKKGIITVYPIRSGGRRYSTLYEVNVDHLLSLSVYDGSLPIESRVRRASIEVLPPPEGVQSAEIIEFSSVLLNKTKK